VLRHNPDIDELVLLPRASSGRAWATISKLGRKSDIAVGLAPRTYDIILAGISRAAKRVGYVYRRRYFSRMLAQLCLTDWCLSDADPELADRFPFEPVLHEVRQVLALVRLAGGDELTEKLTLRVGDDDVAWAQARAPAGAIVVALAPRWFARNFGADAVHKLISALALEHENVLVTYGSDTEADAASVRERVKAANVSWLGNLSLLHWAAVLAQSSVIITVDTGATHVAAALDKPVVVLFEREYFRLCSQEWGPWRVPSAIFCKPPLGADPEPLLDDIVAASKSLQDRRSVAASS
jgi:ADP-heptose:LPS heptosyltransferase